MNTRDAVVAPALLQCVMTYIQGTVALLNPQLNSSNGFTSSHAQCSRQMQHLECPKWRCLEPNATGTFWECSEVKHEALLVISF